MRLVLIEEDTCYFIPNYLPDGVSVTIQSENGCLGMAADPSLSGGERDTHWIDARFGYHLIDVAVLYRLFGVGRHRQAVGYGGRETQHTDGCRNGYPADLPVSVALGIR